MPVLGPNNALQRTALDFIKSALRLVGSLRSGLNLSADEQSDCQLVLNDMLDAWSGQRVTVPGTSIITKDQNQNTLTLTPSKASYTLGNATGNENLLLPRPPHIERVSIQYSASQQTPVELPMEMADDVKWQGVVNKSITSILPQVCFPDESNAVFPDTVLNFWPMPTQANPIIIYAQVALTSFADLTAPFLFPPAYARAIRYNLAVDLAAEFPCDLTKLPLVKERAERYFNEIVIINSQPKEAVCDEALVGSYGKQGNIFSGTANRSLRY